VRLLRSSRLVWSQSGERARLGQEPPVTCVVGERSQRKPKAGDLLERCGLHFSDQRSWGSWQGVEGPEDGRYWLGGWRRRRRQACDLTAFTFAPTRSALCFTAARCSSRGIVRQKSLRLHVGMAIVWARDCWLKRCSGVSGLPSFVPYSC
jgi:hypothetical protein